ncbi:hypothetical protein CYMTET_41919, partial [Cymbomonas tetramitiformis]
MWLDRPPGDPREMREMRPRDLKSFRSGDPLASCSASCNNNGWCEGKMCRCFYGWRGRSCEMRSPTYCFSACSMNGQCIGGFCHCKPGFYGVDCSLVKNPDGEGSLLYWDVASAPPGAPPRLPPAKPRVYVYDLKPWFTSQSVSMAWDLNGDFSRPIGYAFMERMLSSRHRTADPLDADYFFVPVVGAKPIRRAAALEHLRND